MLDISLKGRKPSQGERVTTNGKPGGKMNSEIPHQVADYKTYLENVSLENSEILLHKYLIYGELKWNFLLITKSNLCTYLRGEVRPFIRIVLFTSLLPSAMRTKNSAFRGWNLWEYMIPFHIRNITVPRGKNKAMTMAKTNYLQLNM